MWLKTLINVCYIPVHFYIITLTLWNTVDRRFSWRAALNFFTTRSRGQRKNSHNSVEARFSRYATLCEIWCIVIYKVFKMVTSFLHLELSPIFNVSRDFYFNWSLWYIKLRLTVRSHQWYQGRFFHTTIPFNSCITPFDSTWNRSQPSLLIVLHNIQATKLWNHLINWRYERKWLQLFLQKFDLV